MPTREELHKLIDSMSEEAIQSGYRVLSYIQAPSISGDMRQLLQTRLLQLKPLTKTATDFSGSSHYDSDRDSGVFSPSIGTVTPTCRKHSGWP